MAITDTQQGGTKVERALQNLLVDFRHASNASRVVVIVLLAFFVWVAYVEFSGYELSVNEDASGYWINDHYTHIHLYSWWGLRDRYYDVQKRPIPGEDYSAWYVREIEVKNAQCRQLFQIEQYDASLPTIVFR